MKLISILAAVLLAIALTGWIGLQVKPRPFKMPQLPQSPIRTMPIPEGLPAPVERFYHTLYGDQVPVIDSVVITGRGRMRPFGIWLPARFVIVHRAGYDYRHYFEATFFGIPFLKVNEGYVDGKSFFESPMGTYHDDPNTNQAANLALWAEGGWFPALWLTDPRIRWEAVDDNTALLRVPYEDQAETFVVRFDPATGLVDLMEAMRFRTPQDKRKMLWITSSPADGSTAYATWLDDGKPWAALQQEGMLQNADVSQYIRARGK